MLSEESMVDVLAIGVEMVKDDAGVAGVAGCEDDYLELFGEILQDFFAVGSDVDAGFDYLAGGEFDWKFDVVVDVQVFVAMNKSLVKVKDQCLFV